MTASTPRRVNALTVDVEDYFHVQAFASVIDRSRWGTYASRVERNTQRLLAMFDTHRIKATFFVLGWVAKRYPALVREIHAEGHEVASHGMTHELVYTQTPAVFREQTRESKSILEDLNGAPVRGYRAASYSVTRASIWALEILQELGFAYDSSVFPVAHDTYGVPDAPRHPFHPGDRRMLEIPLTTVEIAGVRLPCAGGGYFRILPYGVTRWALRRVNAHDGLPAIFYLHPWEIDPQQPRVPGAPMKSRFRHYFNLGRTEGRLGRLLKDFSWDRVDRVFDVA